MNRSGYTDDIESWQLIKWRGQVASAIRGKRGQALLLDLLRALDAMEKKELIDKELVDSSGKVCALGAIGKLRELDMAGVDPEDSGRVASMFGIADQLAREIVYMNDEDGGGEETPEQRYSRMREWCIELLQPIHMEEA